MGGTDQIGRPVAVAVTADVVLKEASVTDVVVEVNKLKLDFETTINKMKLDFETTVTDLQSQVAVLTNENAGLNSSLGDHTALIAAQQSRIGIMKARNDEQQITIDSLSGNLNVLNSTFNTKVMFTALYTKRERVTTGIILKFASVQVNVGNGYDPSTGRFTAPVSGWYSLGFSAMCDSSNGNGLHIEAFCNNKIVFGIHSDCASDYDTTSNAAVVKLDLNDECYVKPYESSNIYGGYHSASIFTGHLISLS